MRPLPQGHVVIARRTAGRPDLRIVDQIDVLRERLDDELASGVGEPLSAARAARIQTLASELVHASVRSAFIFGCQAGGLSYGGAVVAWNEASRFGRGMKERDRG